MLFLICHWIRSYDSLISKKNSKNVWKYIYNLQIFEHRDKNKYIRFSNEQYKTVASITCIDKNALRNYASISDKAHLYPNEERLK